MLSNSCSICQTIGSGLAASASRWESAITVLVARGRQPHPVAQLEVFVDGFATN